MDDFTFCGRHISEFGAEAAFGESMRIGGKANRGEYALASGGSVIIGETIWGAITRSVVILPRRGVDADGCWRRDILNWLQQGRGELIVDHDPAVVQIASFDAESVYSTRSWPAGCLEMTVTLQPLVYAARESSSRIRAADGEETDVYLTLDSVLKAPVYARIACVSGEITAATISAGVGVLHLPNLHLQPGDVLEYDAGQLLHDPAALRINGDVDFSGAKGGSWALLYYELGGNAIRVRVTGGEADVTVSARGRYIA